MPDWPAWDRPKLTPAQELNKAQDSDAETAPLAPASEPAAPCPPSPPVEAAPPATDEALLHLLGGLIAGSREAVAELRDRLVREETRLGQLVTTYDTLVSVFRGEAANG